MGYIKEPIYVTFTVDTKPLSMKDRVKISEAIVNFKTTGKKTKVRKTTTKKDKTAV